MKLSNNKILITGGASGIGSGIAERFLKENNTVIICGRRESALNEAKKKFPALITKQCDLSSEKEREDLFRWVSKEHPDLNVLVNNAGIQQWMSLTDEDFYKRAKEEITTNIEAPLHLISLFLQHRSLTTIMNVTSGLSFVPMIKTPVYSATKAFFHSLTVSSRALLKSKNIEVIEIIPPALNTDLGGKGLHDFAPPVSEFIESIFTQLREGKTELTFGFSENISKAGQEILQPVFNRMNQLDNK
ncbi:MAG: SDR family oxidoreductase [Bacteroidia bacterium]